MHISQRKKSFCQNCQYPLVQEYNFCPSCGQENSDKQVSFGTLINEFLSNYVAYDSRLVRTIPPFLFKPGFLTNEFNAGRRTRYMHPLRLYFIVSFFYFFILSTIISKEVIINSGQADNSTQQNEKAVFLQLDSASKEIEQEIRKEIPSISKQVDSSEKQSTMGETIQTQMPDSSSGTRDASLDLDLNSTKWEVLKIPGIKPEQVLDSLQAHKTAFNLLLARQGIKIFQEKGQNIATYLVSTTSKMMFLLLPFFAFMLKIFYIRKNRYYVDHITFTLHLHSFLFFILSVLIVINYYWPLDLIITLTTLLIIVYFLLAFKRVYKQGWIKTFVKTVFVFIAYLLSLGVFLTATIIISLLLF